MVVRVVKPLPSNKPRITVYLEQRLKTKVERIATKLGMSTSELAIEALETFAQEFNNSETIKIRLPTDKQDQLKEIAREEFRSMEDQASVFVVKALKEFEAEE